MLTPRPLPHPLPQPHPDAASDASAPSSISKQPPGGCSVWPLVEIIELKWLLAGEGIHIHVERLQNDPAYACRALDTAAASANPALRATALRLRIRLLPVSQEPPPAGLQTL